MLSYVYFLSSCVWLAIVFAINDGYAFAVANVILNIQKFHPELDFDIVIYCNGVSDRNRQVLNKISGKNITYIEYNYEIFSQKCPNVPKDAPFIVKWSVLPCAHYEIFDLLETYHKVLYLDADLYILGSIDEVLASKGIAWRASAADFHGFVKGFMDIPQEYTMPNGGLVFVDDSLLEKSSEFTKICYKLLNDLWSKARQDKGQDEIILGVLNYKYNLQVNLLPMIYNCPLGGKQTNKAVILHFMGDIAKIWNNVILMNFFPEFKQNIKTFVQAGGEFTLNDDKYITAQKRYSKSHSLLQAYNHIRYTVMWSRLFDPIELANILPNEIIMPYMYSRNFIQFYIKGLPSYIHYELKFSEGNSKIYVSFHVEKAISLSDDNIKQIKQLCEFIHFDNNINAGIISIEQVCKISNAVDTLIMFIKTSLNQFTQIIKSEIQKTKDSKNQDVINLPIIIANKTVNNINLDLNNRIMGEVTLTNSSIKFYGKNNIVYFPKNLEIVNSNIIFEGDNSIVVICGRKSGAFKMRLGSFSNILVGTNAHFGISEIFAESHKSIVIGNDFLCAFNVKIWNTDAHIMFDNATKNIINSGKNILIGDHVWVAFNSLVLKGSIIGSGGVLGANSLCTASTVIPSNACSAGSPCKCLKTNISWNRSSPIHDVVSSDLFSEDYVYAYSSDTVNIDDMFKSLNTLSDTTERLKYINQIFVTNNSKNRFYYGDVENSNK